MRCAARHKRRTPILVHAASLLALAFAAPSPAAETVYDPHPLRTLARGPLLRLLDDPQIVQLLKFDDAEKKAFEKFAKKVAEKQAEAFKAVGGQGQASAELRLGQDMPLRAASLQADFAKLFGVERLRKLFGISFSVWGPSTFLAPGADQVFELTVEQSRRLEAAVAHSTDAEGKLREKGSPAATALAEVQSDLDRKLLSILTPAQRRRYDELAGKPLHFKPNLTVEGEEDRERELVARKQNVRIALDPGRALRILEIEDFVDQLRLKPEARRSLESFVVQRAKEERELAVIKADESESATERSKKLAALERRLEEGLAERIGAEKMQRYREVLLQVRGAAGAFAPPHAAMLGVDPAMKQTALQRAQAAMEEMVRKASESGAEPDASPAATLDFRNRMETAMFATLSKDQRKKFAELCGKPVDPATLARIKRKAFGRQ
ncbi:MAG TPA: hypothetical protein VNC50_06665 [Planctomycetia bacterium]|nr:hypothetical protein [Planctomycetia bacterium]